MKTRIANKIKMYDQVDLVCTSYAAVWGTVPAFSEAHATFTELLAELKQNSIVQNDVVSGVASSKKAITNKVVALAIITSKALSAYALKTGDAELLARNIYSRSEWFRGNALLRSARLARLLEDVLAHETALQDYGIESGFIANLQAQISVYNTASQSTRAAVVNRKRATAALERLTRDIDSLLNGQLDHIMEIFRETDPAFVEDYFNARIIVDLKGPRKGGSENESNTEGHEE